MSRQVLVVLVLLFTSTCLLTQTPITRIESTESGGDLVTPTSSPLPLHKQVLTIPMLQSHSTIRDNRLVISDLPEMTLIDDVVVSSYMANLRPIIDLAGVTISSPNQVLSGSYTTNYLIDGASNTTIRDATFHNFNGNFSLSVLNSNNLSISNVVFDNINNTDAAYPDMSVIFTKDSYGLNITGLDFTGIHPYSGGLLTYLTLENCSNSIVSTVHADNSRYYGQNLSFSTMGISMSATVNTTIQSINFEYQVSTGSSVSGGLYALTSHDLTIGTYTLSYFSGDANFAGITIGNTDNVTIGTVSINHVYGTMTNGFSLSNGMNYSISSIDMHYFNGSVNGLSLNSIVGLKVDSLIVSISEDTVKSFQGVSVDNSSNVTIVTPTIIDVTTQGDFSGFSLTNSQNITLNTTKIMAVTSTGGKITGLDASVVDLLYLNGFIYFNITSTATGLDFNNTKTIYGIVLNQVTSFSIKDVTINDLDGNFNVFGIHVTAGTGRLDNMGLNLIQGKTVTGIRFDDSKVEMIGTNAIISIIGQKSYGFWLEDSDDSVIENLTISDFQLNTFGSAFTLIQSAHVILRHIEVIQVSIDAPFFDIDLISLTNITHTILDDILIQNIISTTVDVTLVSLVDCQNVSIRFSKLDDGTSKGGSTIGLHSVNTTNLSVYNTTLSKLVGGTSTTISLDSLDQADGYGFIFTNTLSSNVYNNTISSVNQWLVQDDISTVAFSSNLINGLQDYVITVTRPADILYDTDQNGPNKVIIWSATVSDTNKTDIYKIYKDGILVETGNWTSGDTVSFALSGLSFGVYIYRIEFIQVNGVVSTDSVTVTAVELTDPAFAQQPDDLRGVYGKDISLSWTVNEANPADYSIFRNGSEVIFGSYQSGVPIVFDLSTTPIGNYIFTITVRDQSGNSKTDSVSVTIVEPRTLEIISSPQELTYVVDTTGNYINFTIDGTLGGDFIVTEEDVNLASGKWTPRTVISFNIDGLSIGQYTYDFLVIDSDGNTLQFSVVIYVIAKPVTAQTSDRFDIATLTGLVQGVTNFELTPQYLIPLAAALFAGGLIFVPGMRFIRKNASKIKKGTTRSRSTKKNSKK